MHVLFKLKTVQRSIEYVSYLQQVYASVYFACVKMYVITCFFNDYTLQYRIMQNLFFYAKSKYKKGNILLRLKQL